MKAVTQLGIAKAAGVGSATVERVLNARGNVAQHTVEKVIIAAKKLGYVREMPVLHRGIIRIEIIMGRLDTSFFEILGKAISSLSETLDRSVFLHKTFVDEHDPKAISNAILNPPFRRAGLILAIPNHPGVHQSLENVIRAGTKTVSISSKITAIDAGYHIGIDNYAAGRTVAHFMSGMNRHRNGRFIAVCNNETHESHQERIRGFSDYLQEAGGTKHQLASVIYDQGEYNRSTELLNRALVADADIIGVYNCGGGISYISDTIAKWKKNRDLYWASHDLFASSLKYLKSGLMDIIIDQQPEIQAKIAVETLLHHIGIIQAIVRTDPVPFLTITRENY